MELCWSEPLTLNLDLACPHPENRNGRLRCSHIPDDLAIESNDVASTTDEMPRRHFPSPEDVLRFYSCSPRSLSNRWSEDCTSSLGSPPRG